jgi:DNA-directed RNA polymerase specialized sigma24 family protein
MYLAPETNVETLSVETLTQGVREKLARFRLADDDDAVTSVTTDAYLEIRKFNGIGEFRAFVFRVLGWKVHEFIRNRRRRQNFVGFLPEQFDGADVKSEPKEGFDLKEIAGYLTPTEQTLVASLIAGKTIDDLVESGYDRRSLSTIFSRIKGKCAA